MATRKEGTRVRLQRGGVLGQLHVCDSLTLSLAGNSWENRASATHPLGDFLRLEG